MCLLEARPIVQLMFALRFLAGGALCSHGNVGVGFCGGLAAWLSAAVCAYLWNGCSDLDGDRINGSTRPLAAGRLSVRTALSVAGALAVTSVALTWWFVPACTAHTVALLILGYAYSFGRRALKTTPLGVLVAALLIGLLSYDAGRVAAGGGCSAELLVFAVGATLWTVVGAVVKDLDQLPGDLASGRRPLISRMPYSWVRNGVSVVALTVALGVAGAVAATGVPLLASATALLVGVAAFVVGMPPQLVSTTSEARNRPYFAYMYTQYGVHIGALAERTLL